MSGNDPVKGVCQAPKLNAALKPAVGTASDRYALIRQALAAGNPELAAAIDNETKCPDCDGYVSSDGVTVDPDKCCDRCQP